MIDIIEDIAQFKVVRNYNLDMPVGVRGRSSNNEKIIKELGWQPKYSLRQGLEKTYYWIEEMLTNRKNESSIFTKS